MPIPAFVSRRSPLQLLLVLTLLATILPVVAAPPPAEAATVTIGGAVYDNDTFDPLPGMSIRVRDNEAFDQTTTTDGSGAWSMSGVPEGTYLDLLVYDGTGAGYGFVADSIYGSEGEYVEHHLSPGTMVSGTVTTSSLEPVPGVEVATWTGPDPVVTDVNGEFAFPYPFPAGYRSLTYTPPAESGLLARDVEYDLVGGAPTVLDVVLSAPGSMSGTVTAADGVTGLVDIDVTLLNTDPACLWDCEFGTTTASDGTWTVTDLPPGDFTVRFEDWWNGVYATEYYDGVIRPADAMWVGVAEGVETTGIDATLDVATSISGTVMAHGYPVHDADVTLFEGGTAPENEVDWTYLSDDTSFQFNSLRPGTYHVLVELGSIQHWHGPTGAAGDAADVTPTSETPVAGLDVQLQDVAVIDATVQFDTQPLADLELEHFHDGTSEWQWQWTDGAGQATFIVPPGSATIESYGAFHQTEPLVVSPAAGDVLTPVISATAAPYLGTAGNLGGVVVDPAAPDTEGVLTVEPNTAVTITVTACEGAWDTWLTLSSRNGSGWYGTTLTETSAGTYQASLPDGVAPGLYDGSAQIWCDTTDDYIEFGLYAPAQLQAVDRAGTPLVGVQATLSNYWTGTPLGMPTALLAPITPDPTQATDADGMFGWLADPYQDYTLELSDGSCTTSHEGLWSDQLLENTFELDCGPLPQDAPGLWGIVRDADTTSALPGMEVQLWGWNDTTWQYELVTTTTSDADGVYAFGDEHVDASSDYDLYAIDPSEQYGMGSGGAWLDVDAMVVREDLHMSPLSTIVSGTVTSKAGPVEGARVSGFGPAMLTDATGGYRSVALPRNDFFWFEVQPPDGSELFWGWGEVETTTAEVTSDVYLESPGAVTGTVTDGSSPLAGIIVSSASFGQVTTGPDGTFVATGVHPGTDVVVQFYDETGTYAYEWFDDKPSEAEADRFSVVEGETTENINAILGPGASITGIVTAVGGSPIPYEHVVLYDGTGAYLSDTMTDETGHYAFPGVQVGSYIVGYEGVGGPWYPGGTSEKSSATPTEVVSTGTEVVQDLQVPGVGFVGGVVRQNGTPVVGAWVDAEDASWWWGSDTTGDGGSYSIAAPVGTIDVTAHIDMWSEPATVTGLTISEGAVTVQDFDLTSQLPGDTSPPPTGTSVTGSRTSSSGLPTLGPSDPVTVVTTGCVGGTASFDVVEVYPGSGTAATGVTMTEGPDGTYTGTGPALTPGRVYEVRISIDCPGDTPDESTDFGLYIDPAGTIVDTLGDPIEGATATLYRSDTSGGEYTVVPDGSTIMSPENRTNPDVVGADGVFQWLTLEGYYKVRATKDGCTAPDSDATFVETEELPVPPEHVGLVLVLDCGEGTGVPTTSISSGPNTTVATTTATFGFTSDTVGATFECRLDGGAWTTCTSPIQYTSLSQGEHTFEVRASAEGLTDATPATRTWTVDTVAPTTTITGGSSGTVASTTGAVTFTANEAGSTFQCRLDSGAWTACTSPKSYSGLSQGKHTVEVRATDTVGNTDATPATRSWTVDTVAPDTSLTSGPSGTTTSQTASFAFTGASGTSAFQCRLDGGSWSTCTSPKEYGSLAEGDHTFEVRARDAAGNADGTPATRTWTIDLPAAPGPTPEFRDDDDSVFERDIERLAASGITKGCNPPTNDKFCPDEEVTRGAMAAFLVRGMDYPPAPLGRFRDARGHLFEADIVSLAQAGVTKGCNPPTNDRYCPDDNVTRGAMAAFLVRALDLPPAPVGKFRDTGGHLFEADIAALAAAGITKGCNPPANDRFCPDDDVERGEMAAFLVRAGLTD